jgi:phytol kinase
LHDDILPVDSLLPATFTVAARPGTDVIDIDWLRVVGFVTLVVAVWELAGRLKLAGWCRAGDARKLNHVTALAGGAVTFGWLPEPVGRASCYAGMAVAFGLLLVMCAFRNRPVFRTMFAGYARKSDAPHEAFHVWFSWLVSIAGLVAIDRTFGDLTITRTAGLVLGLADGVAEPVGVRWGRRRYRVPSLTRTVEYRSLEGSAAVFVATFLVILSTRSPALPGLALVVAIAVTVAEAASPHGLDNLTIPLTVGGVLFLTSEARP